MASIVPREVLDQMDGTGSWGPLEAIAPSLVHDSVLCDETTLEVVRAVEVPALVLLSTGTTGELPEYATRVVEALPDGRVSARRGLARRTGRGPRATAGRALRGAAGLTGGVGGLSWWSLR